MVDWQRRCNGVAWIYDILVGERCYGVTWIYDGLTPQPIKHRCLEYHYTKLGRYITMHVYPLQIDPTSLLQFSIDLWKNHYTTYISYIYSTMHIYPLQIDLTPPIEHRSLENHYTTCISYIYIAQCTYTHCRLTPPISTIGPCYTITPQRSHI